MGRRKPEALARKRSVGDAHVAEVRNERPRHRRKAREPEGRDRSRCGRERHRNRYFSEEAHDRRKRQHAVPDDVERARHVVIGRELERRERIDLVQELDERIEPHERRNQPAAQDAREPGIHGRTEERGGP